MINQVHLKKELVCWMVKKQKKNINFSFKFMEVTFDFQPKKEMRIKDENQKKWTLVYLF